MTDRFVQIADGAIAAYCAEHPSEATVLGNHEHDDRLEDPSRSAADRRRAELRRLLAQLDGLPGPDDPTGLERATSVDREMLRAEASRELFTLEELDEPSWNALQHNPSTALYALISRDFAPLPDRLTSVASRLRAVPDYLAAARSRLVDPPKAYLEAAIGQLSGTYALIAEELPRLAEQAGRAAELAGPIERAAAAVRNYQGWLGGLLPSAPTEFRLGERRYADKLALTLATAWQPADLLTQAYVDLDRLEAELAELIGVTTGSPAGRAEIAAECDRLAEDAPTSADQLDRCRAALGEATRFVEQHELLTLLHDPVEVLQMPETSRGISVAYCQGPGPLETTPLSTQFAVIPASRDWPVEQVRAYYREYNNHALHNVTVHEAMPGHVEQLSHARRYRGNTLVRWVFESSVFIEGWAVYAEELMIESGYRSEVSAEAARAQRILQLRLQLRRVIVTILDVSVHAGDMDEAAAVALMTGRGYVSKNEARRRWQWLQLVATVPPLYYVGLLEVRELVGDLRAAHPDWTDRQLHDTVLGHGSPPVRHLRTLLGLPSAS
ncbi:MAG: DUF885 domain-containing protein [Jatrophihabitantaceae bacterium]